MTAGVLELDLDLAEISSCSFMMMAGVVEFVRGFSCCDTTAAVFELDLDLLASKGGCDITAGVFELDLDFWSLSSKMRDPDGESAGVTILDPVFEINGLWKIRGYNLQVFATSTTHNVKMLQQSIT